jgi:hypothetical protein
VDLRTILSGLVISSGGVRSYGEDGSGVIAVEVLKAAARQQLAARQGEVDCGLPGRAWLVI